MGKKYVTGGIGFVVVGLLAPGCSSPSGSTSPTNGGGGTFAVYGTVRSDAEEGSKPLAGVEVTIAGDFDGDGVRGAAEVVKVTTSATGFYAAKVTVAKPTRIGIGWRGDGLLPNHKSFRVTGASPLAVDVALARGESFVVSGKRLELPGGGLAVEGLPAGVTGVGRLFNPAQEAEFFPGDFRDDKGTPIVSASFATLEMRDASGAALEKLTAPATLTMAVPRDTWGVVRDMTPGNGRIDVPKYWYDEAKGTWVQEGLGYLADAAGRALAEDELAAMHDGSREGEVAAVYEVTHFSTYNVDFPRGTGTVGVTGKAGGDKGWLDGIRDWFRQFDLVGGGDDKPPANPPKPPKKEPKRDLKKFEDTRANRFRSFTNPSLAPMAGAVLRAEYFDADGTSVGSATFDVADDGSFEIEAPRSEAPGEDLDGNGVRGETFTVSVWAEWYGLRFHVVEGVVPSGVERVIPMGELDLSATLLEAARCRVEGTVRFLDGSAAAGAEVTFLPDRYLETELFDALCGVNGALCNDTAVAGADGGFVFDYPREQTFAIDAFTARTDAPWDSEYAVRKTFAACPAQPVTVTLRSGISYATPTLTVAGDRISWSGGFSLDRLQVFAADGTLKWALYEEARPIAGPVTFGVVPSGATENGPPTGSLASGDVVEIFGSARDPKGYPGRVEANVTLP
jgi:hypothetical protein